jgi:hypothetical protein
MSNSIILNGNGAPFVEDEGDAAEADVYPGAALELDANGDLVKHVQETDLNQQGTAAGLFADLPFDPQKDRTQSYDAGERVRTVYVPVGGKVQARLATGGDLADGARANVGIGDTLETVALGALAAHDGSDTTGDGTGAATETVYDEGALYMALEAVDNSGAAAGVDNQAAIQVVRIA